jgi:hypothetical protein
MFLFNNIHNRDYNNEYPNIPNVIFDISDTQLRNKMNAPWDEIIAGDICCVVRSSRIMTTFYRVENRFRTETPDNHGGCQHVIVGKVVGRLDPNQTMSALLTRYNVNHKYLRNNQFTNGFNVANLGDALGELVVRIRDNKSATIAELENNVVV